MTLAATLALLALAAGPAAAAPGAPPPSPLADLAAALARLPATTPVRVQVEHRFTLTLGDDPPRPEGLVQALAGSGPEGLQVTWSPASLAEADREEQRRAADPDAPAPVRDALLDLKPLGLASTLDAAPELLRALQRAELLEVRADEKDGVMLQLLVLKVTPVLGTRERRYVKELSATARLWLGPDGLPVAAEQVILAKGRAFLVITFESEQRETFRFARAGDRLVALRHETEQRSAGAGERSRRRSVTTVTLLP